VVNLGCIDLNPWNGRCPKYDVPDYVLNLFNTPVISYSGENGLRFHPMVVRNLARPADAQPYGFAINAAQPAKVDHIFDLDQISAANLKYYDDYLADLKQRTGIDATFKEKRYIINPERLSIVAFVQDEKTRQILQAVYLKVAPTASQVTR